MTIIVEVFQHFMTK